MKLRVIVAFNRKAGTFFVHGPKGWTKEKERATIYTDSEMARRSLENVKATAPIGTRAHLLPQSVLREMRAEYDHR